MNIYELEKLATPGPWRQRHGELLGPSGLVGMLYGCRSGEMPQEQNAAFVIHCRNNYMKALEALKRSPWVFGESGRYCRFCLAMEKYGHDDGCSFASLITELEEVKL